MNKQAFLKDKGKLIIIIVGLLLGVFLLLYGSDGGREKEPTDTATERHSETYYTDLLESKLKRFLETVDGVDSAEVFVTLECSTEYDFAKDGSADYLIINGDSGEEAVSVKEIYPQIRGIAVTCTDGDRGAVKERITTIISAALGIPVNKIEVAGQS